MAKPKPMKKKLPENTKKGKKDINKKEHMKKIGDKKDNTKK